MNDEALVDQIKVDYREANLSEANHAMLDYVRVVTLHPAQTKETDIIRLRKNGFSDKAVLEINMIACFFAWCNRLVDGLGVELENFWEIEGVSNV